MGVAGSAERQGSEAVGVHNPRGRSPFLIVCDHASNHLPTEFGTLGLPESDLSRHIAWDPGALPVARGIADALDATLVHSRISRLVIDCNRPLDADNLIWTKSEDTIIPGNQALDAAKRRRRIALAYTPFHETIDAIVRGRLDAGRETILVAIHSFTPVYNGFQRPWHIGVIHDDDSRLAEPLIAALKEDQALTVGINEPYSPADKVYFTLEKHARSRGLPCVMIEIRNDEIGGQAGQRKWADMLSRILEKSRPEIPVTSETAVPSRRSASIA